MPTALSRTRERRFAVDDGRLVEGISAVAVPVVVANGDVAGAIAINMTSARLRNRRIEDLVGILRREVSEIEEKINPHDLTVSG